jgi:hypothetical protein
VAAARFLTMARCPTALLEDVAPVLNEVRGWMAVVEKRPGVLYVRRLPFLHFHLAADDRRRADIRGRAGWRTVDLPRPLSARGRRLFVRELRRRYSERLRPGARTSGRCGSRSRRGRG